MNKAFSFTKNFTKITTLDMHTGGEPLIIILEGYPTFENKGILEIRDELKEKYDHLQKAIMWAFYAYLDIDQLGISCNSKHYAEIIRLDKLIKKQVVKANNNIKHPYENALSFLYGTIFIDKNSLIYNHSKNVCIFAEGEVDRFATGSGISGRCAIHFAKRDKSIIGTNLDVSVTESLKFGP